MDIGKTTEAESLGLLMMKDEKGLIEGAAKGIEGPIVTGREGKMVKEKEKNRRGLETKAIEIVTERGPKEIIETGTGEIEKESVRTGTESMRKDGREIEIEIETGLEDHSAGAGIMNDILIEKGREKAVG